MELVEDQKQNREQVKANVAHAVVQGSKLLDKDLSWYSKYAEIVMVQGQ